MQGAVAKARDKKKDALGALDLDLELQGDGVEVNGTC
jgi:hypothetical protein